MIPVRNAIGGMGNLMFKEAYIYSQMRKAEIPDIYLQNEEFFKDYAQEIKARFRQGIGFVPDVAIHVRRGDYVGSDFHTDLTATDYYDRAMAMFPDRKFFVFSDDPQWCRQKFVGSNFTIVAGQSEVDDFNMMASCQGMILANSSFSWWAGYLNPNWNAKIVAPKEDTWYKDGVIRTKLPFHYEQI